MKTIAARIKPVFAFVFFCPSDMPSNEDQERFFRIAGSLFDAIFLAVVSAGTCFHTTQGSVFPVVIIAFLTRADPQLYAITARGQLPKASFRSRSNLAAASVDFSIE